MIAQRKLMNDSTIPQEREVIHLVQLNSDRPAKVEMSLGTISIDPSQDIDYNIPDKDIDKSLSDLEIEKKYRCNPCQKEFRDKYNYDRHLKSSRHIKKSNGESTTKLYICNVNDCNYDTYNYGSFYRHTQLHKGIVGCAYECLACGGEAIRDKYTLKEHLRKDSHKFNVRDNFPETFIKKNILGYGELGGRLIINAATKAIYIKAKHTNIVKSEENKYLVKGKQAKNKITEDKKDNVDKIILKIADYSNEYYCLNKETKLKLINNAIKWLIQEGINPEEQGYENCNHADDDEIIDNQYIGIYGLINDNPVNYFKTDFGIEVKNII